METFQVKGNTEIPIIKLVLKLKYFSIFPGVGNITMSAEFNFMVDPESAFITLDALTRTDCKIFIAPWEVCRDQSTSLVKL